MKLVVPTCTVRYFPEGQHCHDALDGDLMLVDHGTFLDRTIEKAQEALELTEPDLNGFTWCAHSAIVRGEIDGRTAVSEMGPRGFERRALFDYVARFYAIVSFDVYQEQVNQAMTFDESCEGLYYGWLEYPALILDGLTGAKLSCAWGDALMCSTHCTYVLMGLGLFPDREACSVVPARLALWCGAKPPLPVALE